MKASMFGRKKKGALMKKKKWQLDLEEDDAGSEAETKGGAIICVECEGVPNLRCLDCDSYYCLKCFKESHQSPQLREHAYRPLPGEKIRGLRGIGVNTVGDQWEKEEAAEELVERRQREQEQAAAAATRSRNDESKCDSQDAYLSNGRRSDHLAESRCVLVMNLHFNSHPKDLKTIFHQFGVINEIIVTRGQAFIVYDQAKDAAEAVIGGSTLQPISGRKVRVARTLVATRPRGGTGWKRADDELERKARQYENRKGREEMERDMKKRKRLEKERRETEREERKRKREEEDESRRSRSRSRSRSRGRKRSRSRGRKRSRSRSRVRKRSRSRSRSRSRGRKRNRSRSRGRKRSSSRSKERGRSRGRSRSRSRNRNSGTGSSDHRRDRRGGGGESPIGRSLGHGGGLGAAMGASMGMGGKGRGRGAVLPAWMTQQR